jgi:hypothetical protein
MAWAMTFVRNGTRYVWIALRPAGGVSMMERSRTPARDIWRVRGIGVAVIDRTSMPIASCLRRSFAATPNRCSSSTTSRPSRWNATSFERRRWVPTTTSISPAARPASAVRVASGERNRDTISRRTG